MLKRPLPRGMRRGLGFALTLTVVVSGCYAVKTAQAETTLPQLEGSVIALDVRWLFNGVEVPIMKGRTPGLALVHNGGTLHLGFKTPEYGSNEFECTVKSQRADLSTGQDVSGLFVIACKLSSEGQVFATPTVLTRDGETATIETGTPAGIVSRLEFNASSSEARVAAARETARSDGPTPREGETRFVLRKAPAQETTPPAAPAPR